MKNRIAIILLATLTVPTFAQGHMQGEIDQPKPKHHKINWRVVGIVAGSTAVALVAITSHQASGVAVHSLAGPSGVHAIGPAYPVVPLR